MTKKIRYELVPDEFMDVALVFMAGIDQGYEPNGWKEGKKFEKEANIASIKRHLKDYRSGVLSDGDSKLHPLLHAACRCLMQYYLDKNKTVIQLAKLEPPYWGIDFSAENCLDINDHLANMAKKPNQYFKGDEE